MTGSFKVDEQVFDESMHVVHLLATDALLRSNLGHLVQVSIEALKSGHKLLIAGNGGSAADAQHLAGELVSRFYFDRPALPAIALTTDTSVLTAIGNDYGYADVFARQIAGLGQPGDVFIAISTSGNSPNILKALTTARDKGLVAVGLTGRHGGSMKALCDLCLCAPSDVTPRIQECHLIIEHALCAQIEQALFGHLRRS
jgi:D-sedoheptulose 7-phosphate isomerase